MDMIRKEQGGVVWYSSPQLERAGCAHGFSTRLGGVSPAPWNSMNLGANRGDKPERVAENCRRFCAAIGSDHGAIVRNKQVHGDLVREVTRADTEDPSLPAGVEADGLVTEEPGLCLTVFTADCIPVLLLDPVKGVAAAVHAGWRGTALGIAARAVEKMSGAYGCRRSDILAAIGPGISPCCFETHEDVPLGLREGLGKLAEEYIRPLPGGEKYSVDLKGANRCWLVEAGVPEDQIDLCSACTACNLDTFWSHRRTGENRGSMAAMIQLRSR